MWGFLLVTSQRGYLFEFLAQFNWPWARIQWAIFYGSNFFLETRRSSRSIELLIDLLACLEPEFWPKNPVMHRNPKLQKKQESPTGGLRAGDNSPDAYARELFKHSKDSWSFVVCTEKKTFEIWVCGFRGRSSGLGYALLFFGLSFMTSLPGQWVKMVAQTFLGF